MRRPLAGGLTDWPANSQGLWLPFLEHVRSHGRRWQCLPMGAAKPAFDGAGPDPLHGTRLPAFGAVDGERFGLGPGPVWGFGSACRKPLSQGGKSDPTLSHENHHDLLCENPLWLTKSNSAPIRLFTATMTTLRCSRALTRVRCSKRKPIFQITCADGAVAGGDGRQGGHSQT